MPDIKIEIMPDGQVKLEVEGAKGSECMDLTRFLEEALGEVTARELTSDYYETTQAEVVEVGGDGS